MILAFYYHIPIYLKDNEIFCPGYLGVFLDGLAGEVEELKLFIHQTDSLTNNDYQLQQKNIKIVNLGKKTSSWHRIIFFKKILKSKILKNNFDAFLVRTPSPLAPFFIKFIKPENLFYLIVGDYKISANETAKKSIRDWLVYFFNLYMDNLLLKAVSKINIFVNSPILFEKYKNNSKSTTLIKTTTLSENDFYKREDTCMNKTIQLLYCGRIDLSKGLVELVEATAFLNNIKDNYCLNIVGWEDKPNKPVETLLIEKTKELDLENHVIFHGKKAIGEELNQMYRNADIFVIPSYQEGFPRVIWEAMANSLPVIATNVGGIPQYLTHKKNVFLIKPKSSQNIVDAILEVSYSKELRINMIVNGVLLVKDNTSKNQIKLLISKINAQYPLHW